MTRPHVYDEITNVCSNCGLSSSFVTESGLVDCDREKMVAAIDAIDKLLERRVEKISAPAPGPAVFSHRPQLRIVGVAMLWDDITIVSMPPPMRHHNLIWELRRMGVDSSIVNSMKQGFICSEGKFRSRIAAREIALVAGQLKTGMSTHPHELFSEDVW